METAKQTRILSIKSSVIYGLGIMGVQLVIGLVNSYQSEVFNKMVTVNGSNPASDLMIIAVILLISKTISIIADFVIGHAIDRAHMKGGKMRPWLAIAAFPFAVATMVMFIKIDFSSAGAKYAYITFLSIIWNVLMSLADIPSQGMLALLSPRADERNAAAGIANIGKNIGLGLPGIVVTIVCMITGSSGVGEKEYLITAGAIAAIGGGFLMLIYFQNKEKVVSTVPSSTSFKEMMQELGANKMLVIVFLTFILGFGRTVGINIAVQATCILLRDGVSIPFLNGGAPLYGDQISWIMGLTGGFVTMVMVSIVPFINKKWGEKKTFIVFGVYGFVVSLAAYLIYVLSPGGGFFRSLGGILVMQFFLGFLYGPNSLLPVVMLGDIVDYREWETGKRTEGIQYAVLSLSNKISYALSISVSIFLIGAIGYSASTAEGFRAAGNIAYYITDTMQNRLFFIYILLPGICSILPCIPMLWYKLNEKTKAKVRADLAQRRNEGQ